MGLYRLLNCITRVSHSHDNSCNKQTVNMLKREGSRRLSYEGRENAKAIDQ